MKSMVKTALTLSLLLPLAGCWDCCSSTKKVNEHGEVATHGTTNEKVSKCSHKGCTHDHSKDAHNQPAEEISVVETTETVLDNNDDFQDENIIVMDENMDEMN